LLVRDWRFVMYKLQLYNQKLSHFPIKNLQAVLLVAKTANQGNMNAKFNYKWALCDSSLAL